MPGKTIKGEYRFLRERSETFNFSESHKADGTTNYIEGAIDVNGIWYTLGENKICYDYPENPGMGPSCFWVYKSAEPENCYYGFGLANMTLSGPGDFNNWTARWIIEGSGGSCEAPVS